MVIAQKLRGDIIDEFILEVLEKSEKPVSTREISLTIGVSWHTIDRHCLKLQLADKIYGFRVGNMNLWVINK